MSAAAYSRLDRWLHQLAFTARPAFTALAEAEDRLFARQLEKITPDRAVWVASLPRAGTTLLLETLEASPEFCCHTYRDMPFLMVPLFWSRLSRRFHQDSQPQERAHGDGMLVNVDSPEAFEEALWAAFWRPQYSDDAIKPWDPRLRHEAFEYFFRQHIRKMILLRSPATGQAARYLSKNNLNIARLEYLAKIFPTATLIVPFREPLQHAASLLKQHLNFLKIHQQDVFASRYMRDIGHYDFGHNLKPVNFDGWRERYPDLDPTTLAFWLRYWLETYTHILARLKPAICLFSFDQFCEQPRNSMAVLAERIGVEDRANFLASAERAKSPRVHVIDATGIPDDWLTQAERLYQQLRASAINGEKGR